MVRARLGERGVEEDAPLLGGEAIILRVAHDVGPTEIPGLEGGAHGQQIIELRERDEVLGPGPAREHVLVIGRDVLARSARKADAWFSASDEQCKGQCDEKDPRHDNPSWRAPVARLSRCSVIVSTEEAEVLPTRA